MVTDVMAHEPGMAQYDHASQALHHLHGNLIGTTERMTDAFGSIARRAVYTAFGELIDESGAVGTRYGYAGAYGYQSASSQKPIDPLAELGWLHVGERYYDPSTSRFVQRDPIGIRGGPNVYVYVMNAPASGVDPAGLLSPLSWILRDEYTGEFWIDITGGRNSWMDDKEKVDRVSKYFAYAGMTCAAIATGGMAAELYFAATPAILAGGGTSGSVMVTEIVRRASGAGADGGISMIIRTRIDGVCVYVQHVVYRWGPVIHRDDKFGVNPPYPGGLN
jgi:RHS repeat-associated protein